MPVVLLALKPAILAPWAEAMRAAAAEQGVGIDLRTDPAAVDPAEVEHLVFAHGGPIRDYRPYAHVKLAQSVWAGVERLLADPTLPPEMRLCRMVEPGLTEGMRDYVVAHVMRRHVGLDVYVRGEEGEWFEGAPPLARSRGVGVLGLGELGAEAARALARLGFRVSGWSRTPKRIEGVECRHGPEGLDAVLRGAEILVLLLPRTPATETILDAAALARLPEGAAIVNGGRGELIDDDALLAALDSGRLGHATLDVFREEPLPGGHPFRRHPRVTVTPHIASATRPETAAPEVVRQIARAERGEPLVGVVDRGRGY